MLLCCLTLIGLQIFVFQASKKTWSAPGEAVLQRGPQRFVPQHPGADRDSDSDGEGTPVQPAHHRPKKQKKNKSKEEEMTQQFQVTEIRNEIEDMET